MGAFSNIFRALGPAPILRIGGNSQEELRTPPSREVFAALRDLSAAAGVRFIIGLPLEGGNVGLAKRMMELSKEYLGDKVVAFELGNEPGLWDDDVGGLNRRGNWVKEFPNYLAHFHRTANILSGCANDTAPALPGSTRPTLPALQLPHVPPLFGQGRATGATLTGKAKAPLPWVAAADGQLQPGDVPQNVGDANGANAAKGRYTGDTLGKNKRKAVQLALLSVPNSSSSGGDGSGGGPSGGAGGSSTQRQPTSRSLKPAEAPGAAAAAAAAAAKKQREEEDRRKKEAEKQMEAERKKKAKRKREDEERHRREADVRKQQHAREREEVLARQRAAEKQRQQAAAAAAKAAAKLKASPKLHTKPKASPKPHTGSQQQQHKQQKHGQQSQYHRKEHALLKASVAATLGLPAQLQGRRLLAAAAAQAPDSAAAADVGRMGAPKAVIMGPAWHDLGISPNSIRWMGRSGKCYLKEATVHYYTFLGGKSAHVEAILDEAKLRQAVAKFTLLRMAASEAGVGLRVSETNSAIGGGRRGLSNVFGAALWTADTTFEFAAAGATGVNFHWGEGGKPQRGGPDYVGVQTNFRLGNPDLPYPSVHAPWYGYLLFRAATQGANVRFVKGTRSRQSTCGEEVKVWALTGTPDPNSSPPDATSLSLHPTIRVALINKSGDRGCAVNVRVPGGDPSLKAQLHWLKNTGGLSSEAGITWQGQTYAGTLDGLPKGVVKVAKLKPHASTIGAEGPVFRLRLPPGYAALLVVQAAGPPAGG